MNFRAQRKAVRTTRPRLSRVRLLRPKIGVPIDEHEKLACSYEDCFHALYLLVHQQLGARATDQEIGALMGRWIGKAALNLDMKGWEASPGLLDAMEEGEDAVLAAKCDCAECVAERAQQKR